MNIDNYIKAVKALNEAAMCFALLGHMVETTYYSNHVSMALTIFFHHAKDITHLQRELRRYQDEDDSIELLAHNPSSNAKFYTLRLTKNPLV